jgi:hypothetical protein
MHETNASDTEYVVRDSSGRIVQRYNPAKECLGDIVVDLFTITTDLANRLLELDDAIKSCQDDHPCGQSTGVATQSAAQ